VHISEEGLQLIKKWEGLRLTSYKCSAGVWTIGYGSTRGVTEGMTITEEEADERLRRDVETAERCVNASVKVALTEQQFSACVSFVFNLGCGAFGKSTLLRKINEGDDVGAAAEFHKWVNAGGKKLAGLVARRKDEAELFMSA
jgi:lysozyme